MYEVIIKKHSSGNNLEYYIAILKNRNHYAISDEHLAIMCNMNFDEYINILQQYNAFADDWGDYIFTNLEDAERFKKEIVEPRLVMKLLNIV